MKDNLTALAGIANCLILGYLIFFLNKPTKHQYVTSYTCIEDKTGNVRLGHYDSTGTKFTAADFNWVRTNLMAIMHSTNLAIIGITKLDN